MPSKKNPVFEYLSDSKAVTGRVLTGAVTGCRFVKIVTDTDNLWDADRTRPIATASAGDVPLGVAGWDRDSADEYNPNTVTVFRHGVISVTAGEALAAGDLVAVGADGKAVKAAAGAPSFGYAYAAAAIDTLAPIALSL